MYIYVCLCAHVRARFKHILLHRPIQYVYRHTGSRVPAALHSLQLYVTNDNESRDS